MLDKQHVMGAAAAQATRREALIERIGYFADLLSTDPLEDDKGDVAYELLRQAAAQMSSDRLALEASSRQEERLREQEASRIISIKVMRMDESCNRTTFYVRATTNEGLTREVEGHRTGSDYTEGVGLSIEEARDRALMDAATWADFLNLTPEPYVADGVTHEPSMSLSTYGYQREMAARRASPPQAKDAADV